MILVLRVAIGVLLIVAGGFKAHDGLAATASTIAAYRLLPPSIVSVLAVFLPYFEIGLGLYLTIGLLTRVAAAIAAVQFAVFAVAVGSLVVRHIPASCGCFGASQNIPPSWEHVGVDVLLGALCAGIALKAPGALSVDGLLNRRQRETEEPTGEPTA